MAGPLFFEKNKIDYDLGTAVTITVTDAVATDTGSDFVDNMRDRMNDTGWSTTGSTDAANTTLTIAFPSENIDCIHLIDINWKAYTIKYNVSGVWTNFSTTISESTNTSAEKYHSFTDVETDQIQIIITGAMTVDDDKYCAQIVVTETLGQLTTQMNIDDIQIAKNRRQVKMLSGKSKIQRNVGSVSIHMVKEAMVNTADLTLIETLYEYHHGFLVWLCGDLTTQFVTQRIGYRRKDLYLVSLSNEYAPKWRDGRYVHGTNLDLNFVEVI